MTHDMVLERVKFAADQGASQIMIQAASIRRSPEWFERLFRRVAAEYRTWTFTRSPSRKSSPFDRGGAARARGARTPAGRRDEIAAAPAQRFSSSASASRISARKIKRMRGSASCARRSCWHADDGHDDVRFDRNEEERMST